MLRKVESLVNPPQRFVSGDAMPTFTLLTTAGEPKDVFSGAGGARF